MNKIKVTLLSLLYQLGGLVFLYFLCRAFFVLVNHSEFEFSSLTETFSWFFYGLRFDLSAIFLTNAIYIVAILLPLPLAFNNYYRNAQKVLFVGLNSLFLLLNCIDIAYFPFVHKRMSSDAVLFLSGKKGNEFFNMLPTFIVEHWYIWLFYAGLVLLLLMIYKRSLRLSIPVVPSLKVYLLHFFVFVLGVGVTILSIRGGLQKKPLNIIHASEMADVRFIPILLNTPFTLIKTYKKKALPELHYYPDEKLSGCDKGQHLPRHTSVSRKQNVVVIVVESLSQEYISFFNGKGRTPFLDSLFAESMVFPNGFANAKESIQGIPAILSSIPSLQDDPFIFSNYSSNRITSIANLLKKEGYRSSFFHGGGNGTMGFNSYSKLSGFEDYFGRDEYNNDDDFDGSWGIWDEPFLNFMREELDKMPEPFVSSVFTLNTHHPFKVPDKYVNRFKQEGHPILSCVEYADYALAQFFRQAKNSKWYNNTLFVITADHTGPKISEGGTLDDYRIPIVFFKPDGSLKGNSPKIANQIDIVPSVMHLLDYPHPYYSQGKNLFSDECYNFSVNYNSGIYQYIDSSYCYQYDGYKMLGLYNWKSDKAFKRNLATSGHLNEMRKSDEALKKFIQVFNNTMINNEMVFEPVRSGAHPKIMH